MKFLSRTNNILGVVLFTILLGLLFMAFGAPAAPAFAVAFGINLFTANAAPAPNGMVFSLLGYTKTTDCARSGGGKRLYLAKKDDVVEFTLTGGVYDGVTMAASQVFKEYEFEEDTFEIKEDITVENGSYIVTQTLEFFLQKMTQSSRDAVEEIKVESACGLISIGEDNNDNKWVFGYSEAQGKKRGIKLQTSAATTGKVLSDANGTTVTLVCTTTESANTFTGTVPTT